MKPKIVVKAPGPSAKEFINRSERASSPSLVRSYPLVVKRTFGINIEDANGNVFLDFNSGIAVMNIGHSHPKAVKAVE